MLLPLPESSPSAYNIESQLNPAHQMVFAGRDLSQFNCFEHAYHQLITDIIDA